MYWKAMGNLSAAMLSFLTVGKFSLRPEDYQAAAAL